MSVTKGDPCSGERSKENMVLCSFSGILAISEDKSLFGDFLGNRVHERVREQREGTNL